MRVGIYHGLTRRHISGNFKDYDVILTTYETLRADWATDQTLYQQEWYRLILDEG